MHSIKDFKVDAKKFRVEVTNMLNDYHLRVNQLIQAKKNLSDKIKDTDTRLNCEIDKINNQYNTLMEWLKQKKNMAIDEIRRNIAFKNNKIKDKYSIILKQIEKLKEDWNSLNEFNLKINNSSYEEFFRFKNLNQKELLQVGVIVDSWISTWNIPDPYYKENLNWDLDIGKVVSFENEYTGLVNEHRIINRSVRDLKQESNKTNLGPFDGWMFNEKPIKHPSWTNISQNDKTATSTNMNSEYGALQIQDKYTPQYGPNYKFPKRNTLNQSNTQGYSVVNQCYSDNSSMNISSLPNQNNSAVVVTSPSNSKVAWISDIVSRRASAHRRDNTPERNVLKLLNTNSSSTSVSNGKTSKSKEAKNKGLQKKKMKLRNLINNNLYNTKNGKYPKFADIGINFLQGKKKKHELNTSKHQNSEYIDIQTNFSWAQNKENMNSSNVNPNSKPLNPRGKVKKSLSRIKSNYFYQHLGAEIKASASNANLRKTSTRKRRNVNSSANLKSKTKNITNNWYYTHRDREISKRGVEDSKIMAEITETRYK